MRKQNGTNIEENTAVAAEQEVVETAVKEEEAVVEEKEPSQVPADEEPKVSEKPKTGKAANSRYVRVRKTPSANAQVVTIMNTGEEAEILDRVEGFYKVKTKKGGHVGFVASTYFKEG